MDKPSHQRYVSNELTHFLGGGLETDDERFDLLVSILSGGELRACSCPPGLTAERRRDLLKEYPEAFLLKPGSPSSVMLGGSEGSLVEGTSLSVSCICFCDIPLADLSIHMAHYSAFGIAFRKQFLVRCGASPVFYVARDAAVPIPGKPEERQALGQVFNVMEKRVWDIQRYFQDLADPPVDSTGREMFWTIADLLKHVLCFVKGFDALSEPGSDENLYMEREWRTTHNLPFGLADVYRIILPESYTSRLREAIPDYVGQLTFAESVQTSESVSRCNAVEATKE